VAKEKERDAGLVRAMGTWPLAASIISMVIGAGIYIGIATVLGIGSMVALVALASRAEVMGLVTLIGLSILMYLLVQARSAFVRG
jgi:amino acid transporter